MKYLITLSLCLLSGWTVAGEQSSPDCQLRFGNLADNKSLNQFRGQVLYIDFWASWCPPCAKSFPFMNRLQQQYQQQGLQVIAVNLDEQREDAERFLAQNPHGFQIAYDNAGRDCAQAFDVKAMPSSYLIDRAGTIRRVELGFKTEDTDVLQQAVERLLDQPKAESGRDDRK